jgi:hypothetical protein
VSSLHIILEVDGADGLDYSDEARTGEPSIFKVLKGSANYQHLAVTESADYAAPYVFQHKDSEALRTTYSSATKKTRP